MSKLREAAQAALKVLMTEAYAPDAADKAEEILRAALAEQDAEPHELTCVCGRVWSVSDGKEELVS